MTSTTIKNDVGTAAPEKEAAQVRFSKKAAELKARNASTTAPDPIPTDETETALTSDAENVHGARAPSVRLLNKRQVLELTNKTFPTIWKWMIEGRFPPARDLNGRPVWIASEVERFLSNLPIRPYKKNSE